ncbi:MAG: carboxypeptidase regulatory-like domain-containing protein, partial [Candidatus Brocadiia bacterium]
GDMGAVICESVSNNVYGLMFSGGNLESGVPDDFNLPGFMVEIFKKNSPGEPFKFLSRGFFGMNFGPEYNVGPQMASPGDNIPLDIFGPGFDATSSIDIFVYSGGTWIHDSGITHGSVSVINDVPPPGVHLQTMIAIANNAPVGPRKIKVTTDGSVVDIDNRFSIMLPMNVSISGDNIVIDPNGNPVGTDPAKIKLRVFTGPYPSPDITDGFTIDGSGNIIVPFTQKPELKFANGFDIEVIRLSDDTMLGRAMYMKPGVGPDKVMPGSFNIPLDIWAPGLDATSSVAVKVYNGSSWVTDTNFVLDPSTRKIIVEPGNIGGAMKHFQIMMTVKQEAAIGPRKIIVTGSGAVTINNALTVMPNMGSLPADAPFMAGGSNVEEMGTVSPEIMFIGIGFTREILVAPVGTGNYNTVKNAVQIVKLDAAGTPVEGPLDGTVMNPPPPPDSATTVDKNVILFKPTVAMEAYSTYRLTIAQGSITSTGASPQALASAYEVTFTTGPVDTSAPQIVKVDTKASPTEGAIVFQFSKPVNPIDAENTGNYNITVSRPLPNGPVQAKYDPMMNVAILFPYDLAIGDSITGTVSGIYNAPGTVLMTPYTVNTTVQGFQMGTGPMTNNQKAFSPVEVRPTNPCASSDSHYIIRMPIQQQLSAGDKIDIVFPSGFNVTSAIIDQGSPMNNDINGPGTGTVTIRSVSAESISRTITVTLNADTAQPDFIQFELKGIINGPQKNISFDSATGAPSDGYYCTITTKASDGTAKEGPMNSMLFPIAGAAAGALNGNLVDNLETGIADVTVYLDGPGGRKETLTGSEGYFSFTGLAPGGYFLSTQQSPGGGGYAGIMMPIQFFVDNSTKNVGNITLDSTSGGDVTYYDLTISVTSPGTSLAGKQVDVFAGNPSSFYVQTVTLDENGDAAVLNAPVLKVKAGTYMVGVGPAIPKGGMTGQPLVMDWMPPMPTKLDIQENTPLTININVPEATISGTVKDGSSNGIPNAEVFAYSPTGTSMGSRAMTDSSGAFSFKVTAGEYVVGTHAPGMPWIPEKKLVAVNGQTVTVDFKYETLERTISGAVLDSDQRPVTKASVVAYRVDSSNISTAKPLPGFANATTDSSGNFTLFVKPNSYWVLAGFAPDYGELPKQLVTITTSDVSGIKISVASSTMGTVQGTVYCDVVNKVANATVWAEGINGLAYGNKAVTNSQGQYTLKLKQTSGTQKYRLHLWTPETGEIALTDDQALITVTGTLVKNFNLPKKGIITVDFGIQAAGFEAFIHAKSTNNKYQNGGFVKLGAGGTAQVKMNVPVEDPNTTYNLMIAVPGIGDSSTVAEFAGKTAPLTVEEAAYTVNITLPSLVTLSGTIKVTADDGNPVEGAWVSINKKDGPFGKFTKTDADGNFSFDLPAGSYFLTAAHPDYSSKPPVSVTVSNDLTRNLYVDPASETVISGTIYKDSVSASNVASSNTVVWAIDQDGKWAGGKPDSDGTYEINVTDGIWMVQAAGDGYQTTAVNSQKVTVSGAS